MESPFPSPHAYSLTQLGMSRCSSIDADTFLHRNVGQRRAEPSGREDAMQVHRLLQNCKILWAYRCHARKNESNDSYSTALIVLGHAFVAHTIGSFFFDKRPTHLCTVLGKWSGEPLGQQGVQQPPAVFGGRERAGGSVNGEKKTGAEF